MAQRRDGVLNLKLNQPDKLNALSDQMIDGSQPANLPDSKPPLIGRLGPRPCGSYPAGTDSARRKGRRIPQLEEESKAEILAKLENAKVGRTHAATR